MAASSAAPADVQPLTASQLFDAIGPAYESAFAALPAQTASLTWLLSQLAAKTPATCLDIGCGTGRPVCAALAAAGHDVLGIDVSGVMIADATAKVPTARFVKADVREFEPGGEGFDAVCVYFSMIASMTQEEIRESIRRIYGWLRPGGVFVFGTVPISGENLEIKWMGRPVVVSSLSAEEAVEWIRTVGFEVVQHQVSTFMPNAVEAGICEESDVWEEPHLFVYAKKQ